LLTDAFEWFVICHVEVAGKRTGESEREMKHVICNYTANADAGRGKVLSATKQQKCISVTHQTTHAWHHDDGQLKWTKSNVDAMKKAYNCGKLFVLLNQHASKQANRMSIKSFPVNTSRQ